MPQQPRRSRFPALAVAVVLLSACIQDSPLDSLDPQGPFAQTIDNLFWVTFWIATGIFVLVEGGILLAVFVFREKPDSKEPRQIHGNTRLEVAWTVIPALILAGIAVPTVRTVFDLTECGAGAMPIEVIGHQWWFEYRYPESGVISANVLVIPAGQEVCLTMTSDDVIHNYWIPKLNGKRYLVPGEETLLRLQADEPGEYWGQCGEFCGLSHATDACPGRGAHSRASSRCGPPPNSSRRSSPRKATGGKGQGGVPRAGVHPVATTSRGQPARHRNRGDQRARPDPLRQPQRVRRRHPGATRPRTWRSGWPTHLR